MIASAAILAEERYRGVRHYSLHRALARDRGVLNAAWTSSGSHVATLLYLIVGPIVWALHLTIAYGFQSLACAISGPGAGSGWVQPVITAATLLGVLALAPLLGPPLGAPSGERSADDGAQIEPFVSVVARSLAWLSVLAIVAAGSAVWIIPVCSSLR